ncbi:FKBP-type peptidyl-prolyl cis-trans isomerase [Spirosoma soli]|uniref:Peptidyl-prolyl cis-trans isomerase n=1 Tax=Spirosoma soli TaxID=1770529 RepID=A0ABW5M6G1_9BACT
MKFRINHSFWAYGLLSVSALLASCQEPGEALNDRKRRENEAEIEQYIKTNNIAATKTDEGIYFFQTKSVPTGQAPALGDEVRYHFISRRLDGVFVDSTDMAGNNPATVILAGEQTTGITLGRYAGILKLRQGEEGAVLVPAYADGGRVGSLLLPQYTPVRYDLRIVSVRTENQQIEDYIKTNNVAVTTKTDDGVRVALTQARPDSVAIVTGKTVTLNYKGKLLNGGIFDAGVSPLTVRIGDKQVVSGFETALTKLRAGEKATIIFPSALGYGNTSRPQSSASTVAIPAYSPLVFDLEITKVE